METTIKKKMNLSPSNKLRESIFDVITYLFVVLFVYTAISKITTINLFTFTLGQISVFSKINHLLAYAIPGVEILISILLIIPATKRLGLLCSLILMIAFTIFIILMLSFATHLPCSCGGVVQELGWRGHIIFNGVFIVLAIYGLFIHKN